MKTIKRNYYTFGLGTLGRDMLYTMVSMYLIYYLTDVLELSTKSLWAVTTVIVCARIFDALNDPIMGLIVDNTQTRIGKFKPWIILGGIISGLITILLFTDLNLNGSSFVLVFSLLYILWGIGYTANDIAYWSMLPSLSLIRKERERIGAFARLCANIGMFTIVAGIIPLTSLLEKHLGSMKDAYLILVIVIVFIMWLSMFVTVFGVKEKQIVTHKQEKTKFKDLAKTIIKNDQLVWISIAMALFMIGYISTTSFGLYYFKYAFGNESMYSVFAAVLGVSQILALLLFPLFSKKFNRRKLFTFATILVVMGYMVFFFSPMNMIYIGVAGVFMFFGQAFIQLLMLMFLADTVEYGHYKLGKRNESITFSLQPLINKMGGAVASGIVGATVIVSGIVDANSSADMTANGLLILKIAMLVIPLVLILTSYLIYFFKYKINSQFYNEIINTLRKKGELQSGD